MTQSTTPSPAHANDTAAAESEVAQLASELIQIDTSNFGDDSGPGEVEAADYVQQRLLEVGLASERFETTSSKRQGVLLRIPGKNPDRKALLMHGHLDVVPAPEPEWEHPPFSGDIDENGVVWGRGAVDMKDMDAMMLAVIRNWARTGERPDRDIVALWVPDEEAGGDHGAGWLIENRQDMFEGVNEAIGEVGGFSVTIKDDLRLYPIQTAEKGIAWLTAIATGSAGHGSLVAHDPAIVKLCKAAAALGEYRFPIELTDSSEALLRKLEEVTGVELDLDNPDRAVQQLGAIGRVIGATIRDTTNVTTLQAGYKTNVVPDLATASIDGRFLPGHKEEFLAKIQEVLGPDIRLEIQQLHNSVETTFDGPIVDEMITALKAFDDHAHPVPYLMSGGTDAKSFDQLGIRCFGFSPLLLPADVNFFGMFHAVNERVPVESLQFGVRVLNRFLLGG